MKKYIAIVLISISLIFSSCSDDAQFDNVDKNNENRHSVNLEQGEDEDTENIDSSENGLSNENVTYDVLNELQESIIDSDFSHDERVDMSMKYVDYLTTFLEIEANSQLSNDELEDILNYNVVSKTITLNGNQYRVVRYDGLPELFGTLERKWTIIQWSSEDETHIQMLLSKTADTIADIVIVNENEEIIMVAGGYLTSYNPFPIFLSTWKLVENQWVSIDLFDSDITSGEEFEFFENKITLHSNTQEKIQVNSEGKGFTIINEDSGKIQYKIIIEEGEVVIE